MGQTRALQCLVFVAVQFGGFAATASELNGLYHVAFVVICGLIAAAAVRDADLTDPAFERAADVVCEDTPEEDR